MACASAKRRLVRPCSSDFCQAGFAGSLRGQTLAQRRFLAQQASIGPHGGLQFGDEAFHVLVFAWRSGDSDAGMASAADGAHERERIRKHGAGGACAEDEAFKQRIGSQAIGAVHAGACGFACCVEPA